MSGPIDREPEDRREFCRRVLESLSDVIEGEASEEFCREIDRLLGGCRPYLAFRSTLEETVRLTRDLGEAPQPPSFDEARFRRSVEAARERLDRQSG